MALKKNCDFSSSTVKTNVVLKVAADSSNSSPAFGGEAPETRAAMGPRPREAGCTIPALLNCWQHKGRSLQERKTGRGTRRIHFIPSYNLLLSFCSQSALPGKQVRNQYAVKVWVLERGGGASRWPCQPRRPLGS